MAETNESVKSILAISKEYSSDDFQIQIGGYPAVNYYLKATLTKETAIFMGATLLLIFFLLLILYKRLSGVLLPLLFVILSLLSTFGVMSLLNIAFKLPTQILPSFLIAVGIANSAHLLRIFYMHLDSKGGNKKESIVFAFGHSGIAVLLASLTTSVALFTFISAKVDPVADMGISASIGVMINFFYTVILLPSFIAILPLKVRNCSSQKTNVSLIDQLLSAISRITVGHPYKVFSLSILIVIVGSIGLMRLQFQYYPLLYFKDTHPIRTATKTIDQNMSGSISIEAIIDTEKENGLYNPDFLSRIEESIRYLRSIEYGQLSVGKAWSVTSLLKEINQALNENKPSFYRVPQDSDLVAQQLFLFENAGSDDLEYYTDSQRRIARLSIRVPFTDAADCLSFVQDVSDHFKIQFSNEKTSITGLRVLLNETFTNAIITMKRSYMLAFLSVAVIMVFLLGNIRFGILSMVPNIAPVIMILGIMGFVGIKMDLFTMLVGSVVIGIVVDDTIHFFNAFMKYNSQSGDINRSIVETFNTTGGAMLITSVALSIGFGVFMFSTMDNLSDFGFAASAAIVLALLADFFIAPSMLIIFRRFLKIDAKVIQRA